MVRQSESIKAGNLGMARLHNESTAQRLKAGSVPEVSSTGG